jgi:hypothetical protein
MSRLLSRRSFLGRAIATGAVLELPLLGRARPAKAAGAPMNSLVVFVPDGIIPSLWHAKGTETNFTLPTMSDPLNRVKGDCIFLEGVAMYSGEPTHPGGTKKVITGTGPQSLDIFLGQKLKGGAPFDSVQLGVASNFENGSGSISYLGAGQEVKADDNPLNAFSRLFAGKAPAGMGAPVGDPMLRDRQKKSILDAIRGDLTALQAKLGAAEKAKLDTHLQSLREVEGRATAVMTQPTGAACDVAGYNKGGFKIVENYDYPKTYHKVENFITVGQLQMDLAVLALSCSVTHSVSLMWSHAVSPTKIPGVSTIGNHDSSHYGVNPAGDTAKQFILNRRWFMDKFASLLEALKRTPYADATLLDYTVVFLCSDITDGDLHDQRSMPFVVAGGSKGGLKGGRYLNYVGKGQGGQNESHNKLLVSLARAAGVMVDSYGFTGMGSGPLPGLL